MNFTRPEMGGNRCKQTDSWFRLLDLSVSYNEGEIWSRDSQVNKQDTNISQISFLETSASLQHL